MFWKSFGGTIAEWNGIDGVGDGRSVEKVKIGII